jgi:methionine-rich copper-binding protein CopC
MRRHHRVAVALLAGALLVPTFAWSHAEMVKSVPARRSTTTTPPPRVRLSFNERVEAKFSRVSVWDAKGAQVDLKDVEVDPEDPKQLTVGLPALDPGTYTVRFRVLSVDGHVVESQFPFTVRKRP